LFPILYRRTGDVARWDFSSTGETRKIAAESLEDDAGKSIVARGTSVVNKVTKSEVDIGLSNNYMDDM